MVCSKCGETGHNAATCERHHSGDGSSPRHCSVCHKTGHDRRTCPSPKGAAASGGADSTTSHLCSSCGKPGHNRRTCSDSSDDDASDDNDAVANLSKALRSTKLHASPTHEASSGALASAADMRVLAVGELRDVCENLRLPEGGSKDALIERLVAARADYKDFLVEDLKEMLHERGLPNSGLKAELIGRLVASVAADRPVVRPLHKPPHLARDTAPEGFESGPMSRATYKKRMEKIGFAVGEDQDVCHIIAESNGGADHSDNFFLGGRSFNRANGNRSDEMNVAFLGLERGRAAVAVSIKLRNYKGPSAEALYAKGLEALRTLRAVNRAGEL